MAGQEIQRKISQKVLDELTTKTLKLAEIFGETEFYPYQYPFGKRIIKSLLNNEGATITALFSRQCIAEGTLIYTPEGEILPIEKYSGAWKTSDSEKIIEIVSMGRKLKCTTNHPIFTDKGWIAAGDLKIGDKVAILNSWEKWGDSTIPYTLNGENLSFKFNDELAELLGLLLTRLRGATIVYKPGERTIELIRKYFPDCIHNRNKTVFLDGRLKIFLSTIMKMDKYGFPHNVCYLSKQHVHIILSTMVRNNSMWMYHYNKYWIRILTRRNKEFARELSMLFLKFGIRARIGKQRKRYTLEIYGSENIDNTRQFYPEEFNKIREMRRKIFYDIVREPTEEIFALLPVTAIHDAGTSAVWDAEIPEKGWFVAEGFKVHNCTPTGTIVHTRDGQLIPVNESPDAWIAGEDQQIIEITTKSGGKIRCTPEHQIKTETGYVEAGKLSIGDEVVVLDSWDKFGNGQVPYLYTKYEGKAEKTFSGVLTMNDELAELVGWLTADGYLSGKWQSIKFTNTNRHYIDRVRYLVTKYFDDITPKEYVKGNGWDLLLTTNSKDYRNSLKDFIRQLDFYMGYPKGLNFFTRSQVCAFFRGLYAGDGCLGFYTLNDSYRGQFTLACGLSRIKAEYLKELLNKLGIKTSLREQIGEKSTAPQYILCTYDSLSLKRFNENIGEILDKPFLKYWKREPKEPVTFDGPDGEKLTTSKIKSVKDAGKSDVWNIEYEGKGWYLVGGIATKNSGKSQTVAMITAALMLVVPMLSKKYPEDLGYFKRGFWVGVFAPVSDQAVTLFDRIHEMLTTETAKNIITKEFKLPVPKPGGKQGNTLKLANGSLVRMHSAAPRSKIESKTYHLILLDECVSGDTEVLTPDGWIRIDTWEGQKVAVLDSNFCMHYEVPKRYIKHQEAPLLTVKCKHGLEYTMTPGHNIVYTPAKNPKNIKKMRAEAFWKRNNQECKAVRSGLLTDTHKISYLERVGIMLNADGCKYHVKKNGDIVWKLEFSKKRKIERCKYLLKKAGIDYKILESRKFDTQKWNDSTKIVLTLDSTDYKASFREWLPYNCGPDFIRELLHWDGHRCNKTKEYDSTDQKNVEFVEQICIQSGIDCSRIRTITRKNKNHSTLYRLDMGWKTKFSFSKRDNTIESSVGSAYCFETSTGMFFIRKNGVVLVTGNCQDITSFKVGKCFAEGSEVWMPDGTKKSIEQVVKEKLDVITPDGPKTPTDWYDNGLQEVWRVTTATGKEIEVTENHRFLVRRRIGNRQPKMDVLSNIKVGDTIAAPLEVPYFGDKWTYEDGLLTGLMLGDGCFTGGSPLFCGFPAVIGVLKKIVPYNCEVRELKHSESGLIEVVIKSETNCKNSNPVTGMFRSMGLWGHKGVDKFLPEGGSKEFLRGVVEGLIEADGCVSITGNTGSITFANISEKLVRGLQETLLRFGIHGTILVRDNNKKNAFGRGKNYPLWYISIKDSTSVIKFAKEFKLITKQEKLGRLAEIKSTKIPRLQAKDKRRKVDPRLVFERVKAIEYVGVKNTYCLTVDTHLLVVNGLMPGQSISPMGASVNATTVATGTPDIYIGWFYNAIEYNKRHDVDCKEDNRLHYEADYKVVQQYNNMYKKYVAKEIRRLGEDSDEFRMAYRLIWPITRGMLFTRDDLESRCYDKTIDFCEEWTKSPCLAGLDLGKSVDSTVLTIIKPDWTITDEFGNMPKTILDWLEIVGDEWESQYEIIIEKLSHYWIDSMVVDATGVGDPITERLTALLPEVMVCPVVFSPSFKDLAFKYLLQEVKNGRIIIPYKNKTAKKLKRFEGQMLTLKKVYTGKFLNPSCVDEKGHDDFPMSLAMAVYGTYFEAMPEMQIEDNDFFVSDKVNYDIFGRNYSRVRRS